MKKKVRFIFIILLVILIIFSISGVSTATTINDLNAPASNTFKSTGETIVSILTTIGIVISVVVLAALGIKYMIGSIEERADYKKSMMPYFIGAILVFGASTIANIIYKFL